MPTYDYQCESCQHIFEKRQGFNDDPAASCPICSSKARRKISLVPVIFKGNGWYVTDYSKKSSTVSSANGQSESKTEGVKETKDAKDSKGSTTVKETKEAKPETNGHKADFASPKSGSVQPKAESKKETSASKKEA